MYADRMGVRELGAFLKEQREQRDLTQLQVAQASHVSDSYVSRLEAGDPSYKSIGQDVLRGFAALFGTTDEYLEALLYDRPLPRPVPAVPELAREVAIFGDVSAGTGALVEGYEYIGISETRGKLLGAVRVTGECMVPEIRSGDVVIYDRNQRDPRNGQTVVAVVSEPDGDKGVVKRFYRFNGKVKLEPLVGNPIIKTADEVRIEGVVVEVRRKYGG